MLLSYICVTVGITLQTVPGIQTWNVKVLHGIHNLGIQTTELLKRNLQ